VNIAILQHTYNPTTIGWVQGLEARGHHVTVIVSSLREPLGGADHGEVVVVPDMAWTQHWGRRIFKGRAKAVVALPRPGALWRAMRATRPDLVLVKVYSLRNVLASVLALAMGARRLGWLEQVPPAGRSGGCCARSERCLDAGSPRSPRSPARSPCARRGTAALRGAPAPHLRATRRAGRPSARAARGACAAGADRLELHEPGGQATVVDARGGAQGRAARWACDVHLRRTRWAGAGGLSPPDGVDRGDRVARCRRGADERRPPRHVGPLRRA
jgi:hypothetical protein